jgi:amino acid adenylation domain-containing protein
VHVTYRPITADDLSGSSVIGVPIPDLQVFLLDEQQRPVPAGQPGEICVGGAGVGRGYLNRPDLTAQKFIPNPFAAEPNQRLYRSGDLGRCLPNGDLEYLGRIDHQVKIRGFRVELGEIEAVLGGHPAVRECIVTAWETNGGEKDLAAYLVLRPGPPPTVAELRQHLLKKLPDYMVPAAFVGLAALPLTVNGKVDRKALPAPTENRLASGVEFEAPRMPTEAALAKIWCELLGVERVGIHDNFFVLGGHSLLAMRMAFRIQDLLNVELPANAVLEFPTIAELGGQVDATVKDGGRKLQIRPVPLPRPGTGLPARFPVSFNQQQLWFIDQMKPGRSVYNVPMSLRLRGQLNQAALQQGLNHLIGRHEVLRTTFQVENGEPVQVVAPRLVVELPVVDLKVLPEAEREAEAQRLMRRAAGQPFDLSCGPLVRAELLCLDQESHILLVTIHHIVFDGWSVDVLLRELAAGYTAFCAGHPPELAELPIQYADFAGWQQNDLTTAKVEDHLAYWCKELAGVPTALELPTDRPPAAIQHNRGAEQHFKLSSEMVSALRKLGQQQDATLFVTALAAFHVLLHRYSRQEQILIGAPFAGRTGREVEDLIGFFVNALPVKANLAENPPFDELLRRVRDTVWAVQTHQELPFEKLVRELHPSREKNRNPLFQVSMVHQVMPPETNWIPGLAIGFEEIIPPEAMFDLTLSVTERGNELDCALQYNADLFNASTVARLVGSYEKLIAGILANPKQRVSEIPLLTVAERHQLLVDWNNTAADFPRDKCIHELFEAQVERTPEAVAAVYGDGRLTYGELNDRAGRVAERLRRHGVGPEVLVGLYMERSLDLVVGVLGILKAGGAYVPMDPQYPRERVSFMLADAQPLAVLTQQSLRSQLPAHPAQVVCLDAQNEGASAPGSQRADGRCPQADNLAYVIYTSGSTGQPKGVAIEHRNAVNFIQWGREAFSDAEMAGVLASTSICFDLSIFELFVTLSRGGKVILAENALQLSNLAARHEVTLINTVPSAIGELLKDSGVPPGVLVVNLAGEPLSPALVNRLYGLKTVKKVNDLYGPTETTTYSTFALRQPDAKPTIGRPLANTRVYILDDRQEPVPPGVAGELYIGGIGVARGYLNRPELTKEKFICDPFSAEPEARLYRTGDLCRYQANGDIEYLGRLDQQVKIRGFRIELGEIEAVLGEHEAIQESVVVARENKAEEKELAAYLVIREGRVPTVAELREHLMKKLPDYMVPIAFVTLEKLPLTPNGKVDRKALPVPAENRLGSGAEFVAPRTPTEQALAKIWAGLLGVERISIHDNFFALGGHSLMAVRLVFRVRKEFNVELPLRLISELPTIAQLGQAVDKTRKEADTDASHRIGKLDTTASSPSRKLPVSYGQEQLWLINQLEPASPAYNLPLILRIHGRLNRQALQQSLNHLVSRHTALRTVFFNDNGSPVQMVVPALTIDLPAVSLEHVPGSEREAGALRLMIETVNQPFELSRDPLVRMKLFGLEPEKHVLLMVIHHIVWDGWSVEVLLRELAASYAAFREGRPPKLPELPVQYADYAVWQRQYLTPERVAEHLGYWREELAGAPTALELPTDRPHTAIQHNRGAEQRFTLSPATTAGLRQLGQQHDATLFATVLAAFHVLLHRFARQEQVLVGVPFAGRTSSELENLIGYFVNALPVKGDLAGNPRFTELLRQVRDRIWAVQAHQELPFERLVQELQPVREANRNPLFQVCLVFEVMPVEPCPMPGLKVELNKLEPAEAMFDLLLSVTDRGDELDCALRYNADLFNDTTAARLVGSYEKLIASILADPKQRVSEIPLMTDAERHQLLVEWNATAVDYPRDKCIHQLFEAQVERAPEAVAVVFEGGQLTYRELNERANQLAHRLRALGVGTKTPVGLHVDRSVEYVVCALGILKAGGVYVPMDTSYPPQRIQFMLEDSTVKVVITDQPMPGDLNLREIVLLDLAAEAQLIQACSKDNPAHINTAGQPAYVIYTSGSTGQPKGVAVPHRGVVRLVRGQHYAEFDARQRFLLLASTSFDATTFELWGPLLNGAACVVFPKQLQSFEQLETVIRRQGITCLWLTAGLFNQIVDARPSALATVQHVLTGGEALSVPHVQKALSVLPQLRLTNGYGPTESTTFACCFAIKKGMTFPNGSVPIGRPIANTQCYVLDEHLQPVPMGVAGELCIGGDGLAIGYWNHPDLTAEKFIPDPFNAGPENRLYKTGDRVRYLPDGNLEFLGRLDNQVKIRGFRIELGEIETALAAHPNILSAAVIAREDAPGNKQLAAYLVAREGAAPMAAELREFLLKRLPDYMVPAAFVKLEQLPLNPNGKVDRKALPAPDEGRLGSGTPFVAPRTKTEVALAKIWRKLLGVEQIGIHENFFAVGGHSLLAVRMVYEIKRQMKFDLPMRKLFQHPTIQDLANVLQAKKVSERKPELIQLQAGEPGPALYLLIDEGSLGLFKLSHFLGKNLTVFASVVPQSESILKASAKKQYSALPRMEDLAAEHVALIRSRPPAGPVLLAGHCFGGILAFEVAQQLQAAGIQVGAVLLLDTWMANTTFWWEKKAWLREHLGKFFQQGPAYLWHKSRRRIRLEKQELDSKIRFFINDDLNMNVPKSLIFRIYRQAMKGYQPKALAGRGILFVSQDDWLSNAYRPLDDSLGASGYFTDGVEVINVPGNHVTVLNEDHLPELARHFNKCLEQFR